MIVSNIGMSSQEMHDPTVSPKNSETPQLDQIHPVSMVSPQEMISKDIAVEKLKETEVSQPSRVPAMEQQIPDSSLAPIETKTAPAPHSEVNSSLQKLPPSEKIEEDRLQGSNPTDKTQKEEDKTISLENPTQRTTS